MAEIQVLSPSFSNYGTLTSIKDGTVTKEDSGNWRITLKVIKDDGLSNYLTRKNYLQMDDQKFTIRETTTIREGEAKYIHVIAEHVIHELEDHIVAEEYEFRGTLAQHIDELLSHQTGSDFVREIIDVPNHNIVRTITIPAGNLADGLKRILDHYSAKLLLDNYKIKLVSRLYSVPSSVVMEYAVQNQNITRTYSREGVVTRLICRAMVKIKPGEEGPGEIAGDYREMIVPFGGSNGYRTGITRFMDLGYLEDEKHIGSIANDFLSVYAEPDASYALSFAELKRISNIEELYPGRNFTIDTGMAITVKDQELGINLSVPVKSYTYSLTNPEKPSSIILGSFKFFRAPDVNPPPENIVLKERNVIQWAETVMNYVNQVLGGTIRDINPELLVYTPAVGQKKTLSEIVNKLAFMTPDYQGVKYNEPFVIQDPIAEIRRMRFASIQLGYKVIKKYIEDTVGTGGIVSALNYAYTKAYNNGSIASFPPDTGETVFGSMYGPATAEFLYAKSIVQQLNSSVGNISGIYLEIGGGNGGAIGAINNLYDMLTSHGITVSNLAPDDSVGKDGDIWIRYNEENND